ncbi:CheR family methyltransferase [Gemmatimonadota bacterium]
MDQRLFNKFRSLVYEQSGINLGSEKQALVCARVGKRMRTLCIQDHKEYYNRVLQDKTGRELISLLDVISTNVTNFFREEKHFGVLDELLRQWDDEGQTRFRIWCAASSTGEEPYTIAMTVREALGGNLKDTKILATDISTSVLEKAARGEYSENKLEKIPSHLLKRYLKKVTNGSESYYQVKDTLRSLITFGRLNLSVNPYPLKGPFDVVFCRNVMIYFDNEVRKKVLDNIYQLLRPGGYLMVGHAESLTSLVSDFKSVMPSVYIKEPL